MFEDAGAVDDGSVRAAVPANDQERIAALQGFCILDSGQDVRFDRLTQLTSELLFMPIVLVSLVDEARQWFKSVVGTDILQIERRHGFCAHALLAVGNEAFTVVDALNDERFATHPFVVGGPKLRFYSGAPLVTRQGLKIGMLCVHDIKPRPDFGPDEARVLKRLAEVVMDEIDFHRAEVERSLLIGELSHRVKNVFTVISSVATLSGRGNAGAASYIEAFKGRIGAMASAHDKLVHGSWKGLGLETVITSVVAAFQDTNRSAIRVDVPEVTVEPAFAQTLALLFHELLTNAVKYGALSSPDGQVAIRAVVHNDTQRVAFSWQETGGPPVVAPSMEGFGHRMLTMAVQQCGGTLTFDWNRSGLVCEFELFDTGARAVSA